MKTGNLDGQGIAQLQNYKFQMLSSAPTPAEAIFYYDTSLHRFRYHNGTEWVDGAKFAAGLGIDVTAFANGTIKVDFTEVATAAQGGLADSAIQPNDNVSDLTNDAGYITSSDVGNGALTIQRNGTGVGTFTANQTSATTVNISVPTSASDVGAVPTSRTINGKALTSNISLSATDVGALPSDTVIGNANTTIKRNGTAIGTINANATTASTINISVPTTATEVGALPSSTTINDLTTTAQQNALNSGITSSLVTQIGTNQSNISTINGKIPSQASTTNQLADKNFVNSSISTATATFQGTYNSVSALDNITGMDINDYAFVTGTDIDGNTYYDRYKYDGSDWVFEYRLNNSSFTSAQWSAINSGATTTNIGQIATNTSAISGLSTSKQDKLTAGSNIQINGTTISATDTVYTLPAATTSTLGGVKVGTNLSIDANGVLSADAQSITVDTTLSTTSTNPVQNKVVTSAIQSKTSVTFVDWTV